VFRGETNQRTYESFEKHIHKERKGTEKIGGGKTESSPFSQSGFTYKNPVSTEGWVLRKKKKKRTYRYCKKT